MTEPMKGLAEYLRAQAMQRDAMLGKPCPQAIDELRQWAAEVEASRLPQAGAGYDGATTHPEFGVTNRQLAQTGAAPSDALTRLRHTVRTAWMTGVPNYREFYDHALYAVLGITRLQDLYRESETSASPAPSDAAVQQPVAWLVRVLIDPVMGWRTAAYAFRDEIPACDLPPNGEVTPLYTSPLPTAPAGARMLTTQEVTNVIKRYSALIPVCDTDLLIAAITQVAFAEVNGITLAEPKP